MVERTFVMIKPDAVGRRLVGEVIGRYEAKGLKLVGLKMQIVSQELAEKHYAEHHGKTFYPGLVGFITSGPTIQMVWEGEEAISAPSAGISASRCRRTSCTRRTARKRPNARSPCILSRRSCGTTRSPAKPG